MKVGGRGYCAKVSDTLSVRLVLTTIVDRSGIRTLYFYSTESRVSMSLIFRYSSA